MKKLFAALLAAAMSLSLAACGSAPSSSAAETSSAVTSEVSVSSEAPASSSESAPASAEKIDVKIAALKGPTAIGMVKLMDDAAKGETPDNYAFTLAGAPDELVGKIVQGEFDIAAVPTNLAATLYNKTGGKVKLAALNTMGVLYIVEMGDTVQSMVDLKGKTIYATGKGSTPEYALNYLLEKNGIANDVKVEYRTEHAEVASMLAAGQAEIGLLPQPFVTTVLMQNDKARAAIDLTKEWDATGAGGLTMGCIVVQQKFIDEHPDQLKAFLDAYQTSVDFSTNPDTLEETAKLVVAQGIIAKEPVAVKAIPACNIVFQSGEEMKTIASGFLKVLYEQDPKSVGGKLPDDNLYYLG